MRDAIAEAARLVKAPASDFIAPLILALLRGCGAFDLVQRALGRCRRPFAAVARLATVRVLALLLPP
jgi:hypothetical protein